MRCSRREQSQLRSDLHCSLNDKLVICYAGVLYGDGEAQAVQADYGIEAVEREVYQGRGDWDGGYGCGIDVQVDVGGIFRVWKKLTVDFDA